MLGKCELAETPEDRKVEHWEYHAVSTLTCK